MGRKSRSRALSIWANGLRVGTWRIPTRGPMELRYDPGWVSSDEGRPLSLSLPFSVDNAPLKGAAVGAYFDNLLPDSKAIRERVALRFNTGSVDPFDLLAAIGRDCVGAVQLLAADEPPPNVQRIEGTALSDAGVEALLRRTVSTPALGQGEEGDDFRISLAGAQEKTALLWHDGRWMRPHGATPTTHILKLPLGLVGNVQADMHDSGENEWLCSRILEAYGLPVAQSSVATFGAQKVLVVERFDRRLNASGTWWLRLPQEDLCQVKGVDVARKYESDGGPGMTDVAAILVGSTHAERDLPNFFRAQVLFWMLAAIDGHAKNFSLQLLAGGRYRLTPFYDVVSVWPIIGHGPNQFSWDKVKLAMSVRGKNKHYLLREIQRRHFNATAPLCYVGDSAEQVIQDVLAATPGVIEHVAKLAPAGFPARVLDSVLGGLAGSAKRLEAMPAK